MIVIMAYQRVISLSFDVFSSKFFHPDTVQSASVWVVRLVPGLCGSLLVPLSMLIVQELKASTGYLAAIAPVVLLAGNLITKY